MIFFHAAETVSGIGGIQKQPATSFYDIAIIVLHTMEESYKAGVHKTVNIGTACSYSKYAHFPQKSKKFGMVILRKQTLLMASRNECLLLVLMSNLLRRNLISLHNIQ